MSQKKRITFVVTDPSEILEALVGFKDVRVLHYKRSGTSVERVVRAVLCPKCSEPTQVKERPFVHYIDPPFYGRPTDAPQNRFLLPANLLLLPLVVEGRSTPWPKSAPSGDRGRRRWSHHTDQMRR